MIPNSHPYWHVRQIIERHSQIAAIPVSYYTYRPRTIHDERTIRLITREDFLNPHQMLSFLQATPVDQEMAIHSDMRLTDGNHLHLLMIDMSTSSKAQIEKIRPFLGYEFFQTISWFFSGRSFHGYGKSLITKDNWTKFMGLLLLANQPHFEPTVDPRWIGHRLVAGYSALRWTSNTNYYLSLPSIID